MSKTSFWSFIKGVLLKGSTSDPTDNLEGSLWYNSTTDRFKGYAESAVREIVTTDQTQTLTNKTINDGVSSITILDSNFTLQDNGDTTKQLKFEASPVLTGTTATLSVPPASTTLVGTDTTQTLTNKTIDGDTNTIQDLALASLKTELGEANMVLRRDGTGAVVADKDAPTGDFVGTTDTQTLTNKTIDGDDNTVQDLELSSLKTILADANKIIQRDATGAVISGASIPSGGGTLVTTTGAQTISDKTLDNSNIITILDANLTIQDNVDNTKQAKLELSGLTTGTTRTFTLPDASTTLVGTATSQVLTNKDIDGGTASNTTRITVPSGTLAAITALTRKEGTILYATDTDLLYVDNGSTLTPVGAGANTTLSNLVAPTAVNVDLWADGDGTRNLGAAGRRWIALYTLAVANLSGDLTVRAANTLYLQSSTLVRGPTLGSQVSEDYTHSTTLTANTTTTPTVFQFALATIGSIEIEYQMTQATTGERRRGKLTVVGNTTAGTVSITDSYTQTGDVQITPSASVSTGTVSVAFLNGSVTNAVTMRADVKRILA